MDSYGFSGLDPSVMETPAFVVDLGLLEKNLRKLDEVQQRTGCKILLALKGFAMFSAFPLVKQYLHGVCASGLLEAQLGATEFGKEVHTFSPAFVPDDFHEIAKVSGHIVFNSFSQWETYKHDVPESCQCGLRVNPEYSEVAVDLYNPCIAGSRLGIKRDAFEGKDLSGISGLHFHVMCEQNADTLERVLAAFEERFGDLLMQMDWVNFGGGHHITRSDYDSDLLCRLITSVKEKYDIQVYLEPGEAVALNTGILIASVLDIVENDMQIAILDTSAEAHMPDVLAMPYRPQVVGAGMPNEKNHTYRLAGNTCLAGDVIGDYSFDAPLQVGDNLIFLDMAHYSMVKTTMFNGINLPTIATYDPATQQTRIIRSFGYDDYKSRLS